MAIGTFLGAPGIAPGKGIVRGVGTATGTGDTSCIATPGASRANQITFVHIFNSSGTSVGVTLKSAATTIFGPVACPAGGGVNLSFAETPLACGANEAFNFASSAGVTSIVCSAVGYVSKA
jgi:hypothetical protein